MSNDPRTILNEGIKNLYAENRDTMKGYTGFTAAVYKEGALSVKHKELIAIGAYSRCDYCIVSHIYKAMKAGTTDEEIMEAAFVSTAFGGGASVAYTSTLVRDSVKEFRKDFQ
ncbi:MAG: carboxymuconolactone decarboxylase family protein [Tissierellia bacterium]|nr:carboxymuconolactone decarboxylase family protein [Tissierellia bacterium]MDD4726361.1 carboxymuconolactone decarboxylase family protein [Tissierellia bacterium]